MTERVVYAGVLRFLCATPHRLKRSDLRSEIMTLRHYSDPTSSLCCHLSYSFTGTSHCLTSIQTTF